MTVDRLTVEVVKHGLIYASEEMAVSLRRSAYSPNIRERADHTCAVLDAEGRTLGQAEQIPVHIGSLPLGLRNALRYLREEGVEPEEGDMYIVNDPYIAGTHLNDITLIRPIFVEGRLVGYAANKAHHVDVGGTAPASISIQARELMQEGLIIPPTRLMEGGRLRPDILSLLASNVRMPEVMLGDLRAQVAANLLGERRVAELISRVGVEGFSKACGEVLDHAHRLALTEYARMPHGAWSGEDYLELDDQLLTVRATVKLGEDGVEADFAGTDRQVEAPLNAVLGVTVAAVTFAVKTLLSPEIPLNDGFSRTISVTAPEGTLVNPRRPAPVAAGNLETSQRIVDTVYKALADAMPDRVPAASHGSMNNLMMGGTHPVTGKAWAFYETVGGGGGARPGMDGVDGVHVNMTNTMNTPIEVVEHYYPLRFTAYRLREGSGGLGEWRGGMGIERAFRATAKVYASILGERSRVRPWGLRGGLPGAPSEYLVLRASGELERLKSKASLVLNPGDVLIIRTAGGGGYGDPAGASPSGRRESAELAREHSCCPEEGRWL